MGSIKLVDDEDAHIPSLTVEVSLPNVAVYYIYERYLCTEITTLSDCRFVVPCLPPPPQHTVRLAAELCVPHEAPYRSLQVDNIVINTLSILGIYKCDNALHPLFFT